MKAKDMIITLIFTKTNANFTYSQAYLKFSAMWPYVSMLRGMQSVMTMNIKSDARFRNYYC